jgi:hypothetical protein
MLRAFAAVACVLLLLASARATTWTVTSTADSGAGTLRWALASAAGGDTIDVTGVSGTITLTSGQLFVSHNVAVIGPGPGRLSVNGNGASRVFYIAPGLSASIAGLTITNGTAAGTAFLANLGGGIYNDNSTLTVSNCTISGNAAAGGDALGGGIYNDAFEGAASLQVVGCTLSRNSASLAGGSIYNDASSGGTATVTVLASLISASSAQFGGGIYSDGDSGTARLIIRASSLSANSAVGTNGYGGGVYNDGFRSGNATLDISSSTFSNNSAGSAGAAIYNDGESSGNATVIVNTGTLSGNLATGIEGAGGAIYNDGIAGNATLTIATSILDSNSAVGTNGFGGGIYNDGAGGSATANIRSSSLRANSAIGTNGYGGGVYNDGSTHGNAILQISTSTLNGNSAAGSDGAGGGVYNDGFGGSATLTIATSTLNTNVAEFGAGIYNDGESSGTATATVSASTLSGNSARTSGGGIYNDGSSSGSATLKISASTVSANSAGTSGGGIYNDAALGTATLEIGSTILNAGSSGENIFNDHGSITSRGYNLSSDAGGGFLTSSTDQINRNPLLGPLQANGGPTFTHELLPGSPAIDKGKRNVIPALALDTDQRGFPRPAAGSVTNAVGGDGSDIGAFELEATIVPILCPDLIVTWSNLVQTCRTKTDGIHCKVKGTVIVQNIGAIGAPTTVVPFYLSSEDHLSDAGDTLLKEVFTGTVKPGKSKKKKINANLPVGVNGSGKYIFAVVDGLHTLSECNESNNVAIFGPLP